jgi:hypothetical protein
MLVESRYVHDYCDNLTLFELPNLLPFRVGIVQCLTSSIFTPGKIISGFSLIQSR